MVRTEDIVKLRLLVIICLKIAHGVDGSYGVCPRDNQSDQEVQGNNCIEKCEPAADKGDLRS